MEKSDCRSMWESKYPFYYCSVHKKYFKKECDFYEKVLISSKKGSISSKKGQFSENSREKEGQFNLYSPVEMKVNENKSSTSRHPPIADGDMVKKENVVMNFGQGVTTRTRKDLSSRFKKGLSTELNKHSHSFRFVVSIPVLDGWDVRDKVLRSKGFPCEPKAGIGRVFMSSCFGFKCWFADKSITIYFPSWKRYFVEEARIGMNYAVADLFDLMRKIESIFSVSFLIDNTYRFKVAGQHHGLMHNSLAKQYNRDKKKLHIYDKNGELWLLIDNSKPEGFGLNEIETVHKDTAVPDMDDVIDLFFNQTRDTGLMPNDILVMFEKVSQLIEDSSKAHSSALNVMKNEALIPLTAQIKLHLKVQKETLKTLKAIRDEKSPRKKLPKKSSKLHRLRGARELLSRYGW